MSDKVNVAVMRVNKYDGEGTTRAFCDVVIAESFLIKGIRVVDGKKGLLESMAQEVEKGGHWFYKILPLTKEAREKISEAVLSVYQSGDDSPAD